MTKATMLFSFFCGFAIPGVWAMLLLSGQVTELTTAPIEASFLLAAGFATAAALPAAGYGLLRGRAWGARAEVAALGMLLYCAVYSVGVFGEQRNLPAAGFLVVIAALALVFCVYFVRETAVTAGGRCESMIARLLRWFRMTMVYEYGNHVLHGLRHPELLRSGATSEEERRPLPGDELLARPMWQATRAETIRVPPAGVWPWLVQMGYGRASWYARTALQDDPEFGKYCRSADQILPEHQHLAVGDALLDGPTCDPQHGAWIVRAVEPGRTLVLQAARRVAWRPVTLPDFDPAGPRPRGLHFLCVWSFELEPQGDRATRILVRTRCDYGPWWLAWIVRLLYTQGDTVMQRTLLQGIKQRAEGLSRGQASTRPGFSPAQESAQA